MLRSVKSAILGMTLKYLALVAVMSAAWCGVPRSSAQDLATLHAGFANPPDDARIMMRWWWFGPGVVKPELERELLAMKAGGIGGVEIQPVYALALDGATPGFKNLPYLSPAFLDDVSFTAQTARANGLRMDMTLASGWPYGGAHVPIDEAAAKLRVATVDVPGGERSVAIPVLDGGEMLVAAFVGDGSAKDWQPKGLQLVSAAPQDGHLQIEPAAKARVLVLFIMGRTKQQVKRAAVGAEGFVLDHFSRKAIDDHLKIVGEPLMNAFGDKPPYAVFSDSLEVYGADWTNDLLDQFKQRRGYDLRPNLPELWRGTDELAAELRHDWGLTLTELIDENYLTPINDWANAHGTRVRSQTYGDPAVSLSSNRLVALPEGEGPQWDRFSYTRWATSASHLYGRNVTSAETWTWLHSPAFRATPLDMKAEADRFFLQGVNQLIGHGWPYTPPAVAEPGWSFYAAAVFNDHNPWWIVMPEVTKYLQRISWLLRQGKPANDVAVFLPDDDAYAEFKPGKVSLSDLMPKYITPALMQSIESAGYNLDFIDAEAIKNVGIPYAAVVLPHVERMSPETMQALAAYAARGGKVIAVGSVPQHAAGVVKFQEHSAETKKLADALFADKRKARSVAGDGDAGAALAAMAPPDVQLSAGRGAIGFLHRKLDGADIYFVANTSNAVVKTTVEFRARHTHAFALDPMTGSAQAVSAGAIAVDLAPYASRVFVLSDAAMADAAPAVAPAQAKVLVDLSHDWQVSFLDRSGKVEQTQTMGSLTSWSDDKATRFFSGVAVYTHKVTLNADDAAARLVLDFGQGKAVEVDPKIKSGMRALLEGPIREAAVVYVNGKRVSSVWCAPWTADLTGAFHAGDNTIEVRVANTDINLLASRPPTDYKALNAKYGEKFQPQDMNNLEPLPSGMLGSPKLMEIR
jgi:hypothetical protein